jgi:L-arabinose isomerase
LIAAEGVSVEGPVLKLGDTNLRVKFPIPMKDFVNKWSAEGPTHHGVLANGWHTNTLEIVAKVLGLELRIVTRAEYSGAKV